MTTTATAGSPGDTRSGGSSTLLQRRPSLSSIAAAVPLFVYGLWSLRDPRRLKLDSAGNV